MTTPGPGDPETWPPPVGHPNDPRIEEEPDDYEQPEPDWEAIAESIEYERHETAMYRMDKEYG